MAKLQGKTNKGKPVEVTAPDYDARAELSELMLSPLAPDLSERAAHILEVTTKESNLNPEQVRRLSIQLSLSEDLGILDKVEGAFYPDDDAANLTLLAFRRKNKNAEENEAVRNKRREDLINKITKGSKKNTFQIPRNILSPGVEGEDLLNRSLEEKERENIIKLQERGKLLGATTAGLSGGGARFKKFKLMICKTLADQSRGNARRQLTGIPEEEIKEIESSFSVPAPVFWGKGGKRKEMPYPVILLKYDDAIKTMEGRESSSIGGKDRQEFREYFNEIKEKHYLRDVGGYYAGVKLFPLTYPLYSKLSGEEIGCIAILSPDFTLSLQTFAKADANILVKLRGKQKDITMNLLEFLLYNQCSEKICRVPKRDVIRSIRSKEYKKNPQRLEEDYKEAVKKMIEAGVISKYEETGEPEIIAVFSY